MGRGRSDRTIEIVERAHAVLQAEHPMTLRQVFYRLVSVRVLENRQADYRRLGRILTVARERDEIPWEWIVDRSRQEYEPDAFKDPAAFGKVVAHAYRRDYWAEQPCYVEIWTEKDAVMGSIKALTDELGITVRVGRGFNSATNSHEMAKLFSRLGKSIRVFYLGDHDPSGVCIEEVAWKRLWENIGRLVMRGEGTLPHATCERLAIFRDDIERFGLPPLRIKVSDSRARSFLRKHGPECVELDALPVTELRRRVRAAIEDLIDKDAWDRMRVVEQAERKSIREIAGRIGKVIGAS
jgi:hypothetical protein